MAEQTKRDADGTLVGQQRPHSADGTTPTTPATPGVNGDDDASDAPTTTEDERDEVNEASEASFPASDPPSWTGVTADSH